jgi:uncharacterized membrane protein
MHPVYLTVRVLHVLFGAIWLGAIVFIVLFLMPVVQELGPDGAKVMLGLQRRRFVAFMPSIAGLTVVSGFWLYWRFTAGFSAEVNRSHAGMAFGLGGVLGLVALIIGGGVLSRSVVGAIALGQQAAGMPEGPARTEVMKSAAALRDGAAAAGKVVAVLVVSAAICMALARYF